jgi:hypothetical protein
LLLNNDELLYFKDGMFSISWEREIDVNPSPHGLKAITKLKASGLKGPLLPHSLTALWGEWGRRGCLLSSPENLLIKT